MKKLLVLLLVLGLASAASAGLKFSVNGEAPAPDITLKPSQEITLDITGDGQTPAPISAWIFVEGPGSIAGATMLYTGSLSSYDDLESAADVAGVTPEELLAAMGGALEKTFVDLGFAVLAHGGAPQPPLEGKLVDEIIFHCDDIGTVTLTLVDGDTFAEYDSLTIEQIPEPITLALLGLGGLFLRRRK